jgi:hypothetical protein
MSKVLLLTVVIFGPIVLHATDPFLGHWKLNLEKSVFSGDHKPVVGHAQFTRTDDGYLYREAIGYEQGQFATRSTRLRGEMVQRLNENVFRLIRRIDDHQYEVAYTHDSMGRPFCTFRYAVYPQIATMIVAVLRYDEPIETLVFSKE